MGCQNNKDGVGGRGSGRRTRGAFTLVELLVVVSIIALLIAILMPSLRRAREQAKGTKCHANLHAIHLAIVCYADDNKQEMPSYSTMGEYPFRVRPMTTYSPDGSNPYPEFLGIQSVLHEGHGPPRRKASNDLPDYAHLFKGKAVYLPYDSDVWICPANKGPKINIGWKDFGNTYWYRARKPENGESDFMLPDDPDYVGTVNKWYNIDYLATTQTASGRSYASIYIMTMDNYSWLPVESASGRPEKLDDYRIPTEIKRAPHYSFAVKKQSGSMGKYWSAGYADGRVAMKAFDGS